jgi:hypothetical protein
MRLPVEPRIICFMAALTLISCLDPYQPPTSNKNVNFLVVDGFINSSDSLATVILSRAISLNDVSSFPLETTAIVSVEDETGDLIFLNQSQPGTYTIKKYFNVDSRYRLNVSIDGKEFASDFIELLETAPIDSLSWKANNDHLDIYASTHDFSPGFKYYRYTYEETYEYTSAFSSDYKLVGSVVQLRAPEEHIYSCWATNPSSGILLSSTLGLTQNIISNNLLLRITKGDSRLWKKHSLLVRQISLDKEAYDYWVQIKRMSESLGGLFDPIPYEVKGNIQSLSNSEEVVLGYFSGAQVKTKRIVIRFDQLPSGFTGATQGDCTDDYIAVADVPSLNGAPVLLTHAQYEILSIVGYFYSSPECVDCRLQGGTNIQPSFMK